MPTLWRLRRLQSLDKAGIFFSKNQLSKPHRLEEPATKLAEGSRGASIFINVERY